MLRKRLHLTGARACWPPGSACAIGLALVLRRVAEALRKSYGVDLRAGSPPTTS